MNRYSKKVVLKEEAKALIVEEPTWNAFEKQAPLEIEVGFGTGRFLLSYAEQNPEKNLLGVEVTRKMVHHVANKAFSLGLKNIRLVHAEARGFLKEFVPPQTVAGVHVYFPDPWPKKRHIKRRIMGTELLTTVRDILKPRGFLSFFTDHKAYFNFYKEQKALVNGWTEANGNAVEIPSAYELKWKKLGRTIYRTQLVKQKTDAA